MTGLPYFIEHGLVAMLIQLTITFIFGNPLAGLAAGISFYAGREIRDWEKLGFLDWKGLLTPVVACLIVWSLL